MRRLSRDGGCPFERKLLGKGNLDDDGEAVHERTTQSKQHRAAVRQRKPLDIEPILLARQLQEGTEKRAVGQVAAERALLLEGRCSPLPTSPPPSSDRRTRPSRCRLGRARSLCTTRCTPGMSPGDGFGFCRTRQWEPQTQRKPSCMARDSMSASGRPSSALCFFARCLKNSSSWT